MKKVNIIKITAFFLFCSSLLGMLLPLFAHNHLISYGDHEIFPDGIRGTYLIECNISNQFCGPKAINYKPTKIMDCDEKVYRQKLYKDKNLKEKFTGDISVIHENLDAFVILNSDLKFYLYISPVEINKDECIKYSNIYFIYKLFPNLTNLYTKIKSNTSFGTSQVVNPFIYGETSISNIVKRYPFYYIFKPLLFLSSLLMMFYWIGYFIFFKKNGLSKNSSFVFFGCLSAFFLFLHVFFLGNNFDVPNFDKLRRLVIVLFIFFELVAEFLLARKIYINRELLVSMMKRSVIFLKIVFVYTAVLITIISLGYMGLVDQTHRFNNVLEWNYFLFLILFYGMSAIIWKKVER